MQIGPIVLRTAGVSEAGLKSGLVVMDIQMMIAVLLKLHHVERDQHGAHDLTQRLPSRVLALVVVYALIKIIQHINVLHPVSVK